MLDLDPILHELSLVSAAINLLRLAVDACKALNATARNKTSERVALFDNHLKPLYDSLSGIHANYLLMYQRARDAMKPVTMDPQLETPEAFQSVLSSFIKDREEYLRERAALRSNARALVLGAPELKMEAPFSIFYS